MSNRKYFWLIVLVLAIICLLGCEKGPLAAGQATITASPIPADHPEAIGPPAVNRAVCRLLHEVRAVKHTVRVKKHRIKLIEE